MCFSRPSKLPSGARFDGKRCVSNSNPQCPSGTYLKDNLCVSRGSKPHCPPNTNFDGRRCVANTAPSKSPGGCVNVPVCPATPPGDPLTPPKDQAKPRSKPQSEPEPEPEHKPKEAAKKPIKDKAKRARPDLDDTSYNKNDFHCSGR